LVNVLEVEIGVSCEFGIGIGVDNERNVAMAAENKPAYELLMHAMAQYLT
jgi:hypothetical protein